MIELPEFTEEDLDEYTMWINNTKRGNQLISCSSVASCGGCKLDKLKLAASLGDGSLSCCHQAALHVLSMYRPEFILERLL